MTDNNYSECVDYLVSQMNSQTPPTNSQQSYEDYKAKVDKQREEYDGKDIIEALYMFGYKIDKTLEKLINQVDKLLEEDSPPKS